MQIAVGMKGMKLSWSNGAQTQIEWDYYEGSMALVFNSAVQSLCFLVLAMMVDPSLWDPSMWELWNFMCQNLEAEIEDVHLFTFSMHPMKTETWFWLQTVKMLTYCFLPLLQAWLTLTLPQRKRSSCCLCRRNILTITIPFCCITSGIRCSNSWA